MTGVELLESGKRFSVAMWEYSWMLQRHGRQAEYADWDRVLDEVVERGYECLRIDAFPHLIARGKNGETIEETTVSGNFNFMWTNFEPARVNPRSDLVEFMQKMKDRGLYAGLSSWYRFDEFGRERLVQSPEDYARIWIETLDLLDEHDLLDIVVWVDLCNEFPLPLWCLGPAGDILGIEIPSDLKLMGEAFLKIRTPWSDAVISRINEYLTVPIQLVRERYPALKYTFSFSELTSQQLASLDVGEFDLLEPHIWAVQDGALAEKTAFWKGMAGTYPYDVVEHMRAWITQYEENRELVRDSLDTSTTTWSTFASEHRLPLVVSECWATVIFEDLFHGGALGEWESIKDGAELGVRLAIDKGWQGIATSNFCEPHFEGMWHDLEWHRKMTSLIRG